MFNKFFTTINCLNQALQPEVVGPLFYLRCIDLYKLNLIGLLGQIPITKGQPLADNWVKMKDVSDTIEMYFVK